MFPEQQSQQQPWTLPGAGIDPDRAAGEVKPPSTTPNHCLVLRQRGHSLPKPPPPGQDGVGQLVGVALAAAFPPSGLGKPSPTPPAVNTTPISATLLWNCIPPSPCGFGRRRAAILTAGTGDLGLLTQPDRTLPFPPTAGTSGLVTCPPGSGGSRPQRRSRWSLASPDGGGAPAWLLPRPLRLGGSQTRNPAARG